METLLVVKLSQKLKDHFFFFVVAYVEGKRWTRRKYSSLRKDSGGEQKTASALLENVLKRPFNIPTGIAVTRKETCDLSGLRGSMPEPDCMEYDFISFSISLMVYVWLINNCTKWLGIIVLFWLRCMRVKYTSFYLTVLRLDKYCRLKCFCCDFARLITDSLRSSFLSILVVWGLS